MSTWMETSVVSSAAVRNSASNLTQLEEGDVYDWVEQELKRRHRGDGSDDDDYRSICSTSRCTKLDYCQSQLQNQAGVPRSVLSISPAGNPERTRVPRLWGSINHDFVVVHMTGVDSKGKKHHFSIVAEKGGAGQAGELPGIHIGLLGDAEIRDLHQNTLLSWDCFSTPVQLDVLTKALWEDQDPNYNFINKNCWDYAKSACRKVLLLLSKQPKVPSGHRRHFEEQAQEVKSSVVMKAALESSGRGAMYSGALLAGAAIFWTIGLLMPSGKQIETAKPTNRIEDETTDDED